MQSKSRRTFITGVSTGLFAIIARSPTEANPLKSSALTQLSEEYPSTALDDIRAVVGASHTQFERVKELVGARPELAKATYDWGFGDVESALGAASHMGRKDIADFLIEHGARPNIFTFAMMGKIDAVKSSIEALPGIQKSLGPHGFTLMHHAKMRLRRDSVTGAEKKMQEDLVAYLEELGDADQGATNLPISEADKEIYLGVYPFGEGEEDRFEVLLNSRGSLSLQRGSQFGRALLRVGDHSFAPGGAPSVRITFAVSGDKAQSLTIHDSDPIIKVDRA